MVHWCCLFQELKDDGITILQACSTIVMPVDLDASARSGFYLAIGVIVMDYWDEWRKDFSIIKKISVFSESQCKKITACGTKWLKDNNLETIIVPDAIHVTQILKRLSFKLKTTYREDWYNDVVKIFWSPDFKDGIEKLENLYNKYIDIKNVNNKIGIIFEPHFMRRIWPWCNRPNENKS